VGKSSVTLIGPGWGLAEGRKSLLESITAASRALVLDADALRLLAQDIPPAPLSVPAILTPHAGEAAALLGIDTARVLSEAPRVAQEIAQGYGATVILKGAITWVSAPTGKLAVFDGAFPALGTAGSGDVLAGICAAVLASELESLGPGAQPHTLESLIFDCSCKSVLIHAAAGRRCFKKRGEFTADDLLPFVSLAAAWSRAKLDR
jgi:hydroxyethylthiazole kinase-like uncharacterized protein yjeF